ncbi:MAG: tryptophan--tRNA ligase [Clostridia bacterium]|nr:tryptophan--tRNA ligase [Clostridia bacterium]MBO7503464.1 tryptophan--tRNA ligase [Clostridia bacterium]MBO7659250.1 tryptophan--tRNA ligase [Clostridia bacterium]MBP5664938.1 tryptophan--tRNA ligase [Clostridia bacterium]MBP5766149.1 tryptophan--tRNA ligase [Clostridia bacterium]
MTQDKKTIFSGVQPSGNLTLGNYLGALRNFCRLQDEFNCYYCVVDMHTLTVRQNPEELRERSYALLALYLACGLDPEKNVLFLQSHVHSHAELSWILGCYTYMGELSRMTQFKDKSQRHSDNINAGLFTYPVLMAADILLYKSDLVPIGADQKQHLELARNIAERFNAVYGDTFVVPEPFIPGNGARIMSLQEPEKKMSKSDTNVNNFVLITDPRDVIIKKFKKAVTDSGAEIRYDENEKPGISNLINIYASVKDISRQDVEKEFEGGRYGDFKKAVGEAVADTLAPIQERYAEFISDRTYLDSILRRNAEIASGKAEATVREVYEKVGFILK